MRAVRTRHCVIVTQCHACADDRRFLPNAGVIGARDLTRFEQASAFLFKTFGSATYVYTLRAVAPC